MITKIDPFTRTPGVAGDAFINMHYADAVIDNFKSDFSSKYIYKIVGLRGSGKSVEYSKIIQSFQNEKNWLVYTLSAAGDPVTTLIAKLNEENLSGDKVKKKTVSNEFSATGNIGIIQGNAKVGVEKEYAQSDGGYSKEAEMTKLIKAALDKGYRVLVGVDDISKTSEMVKFLSIWGAMLLENYRGIYFICTGLSKNIEDFSTEENLTFFKRSDQIEIKGLDRYEVADSYQKLLNVDRKEAVSLAKFVNGYAYAYQVMGMLYYNKKDTDTWEDLVLQFEKILFQDVYDMLWKSLTSAEKELVKIILFCDSDKVSEIKKKMTNPGNFSMLRIRIERKHLIESEDRGHVKIWIPRFKEFVEIWE